MPFRPLDMGSGMGKKSYHNSESLKTIFWVKILKFFYVDSGSGTEKSPIWDPGNMGLRITWTGPSKIFTNPSTITGDIFSIKHLLVNKKSELKEW